MRLHWALRWLLLAAMLALPTAVAAQEATLSGTVTDTTGGALPGVTVRAVHEASGNSFEAVTDERGDYRIPARVGAYRITAELSGFAPATQTVTLLVGQAAVINLQLSLSGVQESVTVTGEAPLLDVTQSTLGGNIDTRQMQELPVQGRNWMDLVMLAPGSRVNSVTSNPSQDGADNNRSGGDFQINVDGQSVTNYMVALDNAVKRQPRFSREAMAEFEFRSSRFDATQGRSFGMQVNAVTKSGTNTMAGSFSGYFRDDRWNAADHVAKRVLPYENQQLVGTVGGPLRRDRAHFFAYSEFEREPKTLLYNTPYEGFNLDLSTDDTERKVGGRLDVQFSSQTRLSTRGSISRGKVSLGGGATTTPSSASGNDLKNSDLLLVLTQVLSNRAVNEVRGGYSSVGWEYTVRLQNSNGGYLGLGRSGPGIVMTGLDTGSGGASSKFPDRQGQRVYTVRDDVTYSFAKGGRHTMKFGAEFLYQEGYDESCVRCEGLLIATGGPVPANIVSLFPNQFDSATWNLAPLSAITRSWRQAIVENPSSVIPRYSSGAWVQDDWTISPRLTLNLGVRYDLEINAFANDVRFVPFLMGDQPNDMNNIGPRVGFTVTANDRTVVRGGHGIYFGSVPNNHYAKYYEQVLDITIPNDGRPDFASNPWNGPAPTFAELSQRVCTPSLAPGCIRHSLPTGGVLYGPDFVMPYSHQGSVGIQRRVGATMSVEADYVYTGTRGQPRDLPVNVTYNPATGANYPFSDISRRAFPEWGYVNLTVNGARSNYHALQTAFTRRFSGRWQASATYTLSALRDANPRPIQWNGTRFEPVPFATARDLGGEYTYAIGDQRHRSVINGIWELPYGFQLSGLYFYSSGSRFNTQYGGDLRQLGDIRPNDQRLRPDGTIVPRNNFVGRPLHRVDMRVQRRFALGERAGLDGIIEVFNLLNHANFGSYAGTSRSSVQGEPSPNYLQPQQVNNVAYAPRTLQLGFRLAF
jgi:hypothetical protein